jgi:hypothetical protein
MKACNGIKRPGLLVALAVAGLAGCEKDESTPGSGHGEDLRYVYHHSVAEAAYDDAEDVSGGSILGAKDGGPDRLHPVEPLFGPCATVTFDLDSDPKSAVIDFGESDCLGKDGNYRRGRLLVTWSGEFKSTGSVRTIAFEKYYLNFNKVEGTKVIRNEGRNEQGHLVFAAATNGSVQIDPQYSQYGTGGRITYKAASTREWIAGEITPWLTDDVFLVRGQAEGTMTDGVQYTVHTEAQAPLRKEVGFPHFIAGTLIVNPATRGTSTVDYSYLNGQRDNLARVTVEGQSYTAYLGMK